MIHSPVNEVFITVNVDKHRYKFLTQTQMGRQFQRYDTLCKYISTVGKYYCSFNSH